MPSVYLIVFALVSIFAIITMIRTDADKVLYYVSLVITVVFLAIRYGQGTDYTGYLAIYHLAREAFDPKYGIAFYFQNIHSEIGWQIMMIILQFANIDFQTFIIILSGLMMWLTHKFIMRFCKEYKCVALVLFYPTVYLTYYFSGLRQGLAMIVFYGILINTLLNKKYVKYFLGVLAISTVHKASLCYLILPLILYLDKKWLKIGSVISVLVALCMILDPIREIIKCIAVAFGVSAGYFEEPSVGWFSLIERVIMLILILFLWKFNKKKENIRDYAVPLLKIYYTGFLIYVCFCSNAFISSRIAIMFKMSEMVIIPLLLSCVGEKIRRMIFIAFLGISTIMTYKNLNSYAAGYYESVSGWNYPYVTIFNQEDILLYRDEDTRKYPNEEYNFHEHEYFWK